MAVSNNSANNIMAKGVIAFLGEPNVGKSTLLNQLAGKKLAIITHKAQTTRSVLYRSAIFNGEAIVFIDTPGLFAPKISRELYQAAWGAAQDADILLLLSEGKKLSGNKRILESLKKWEKPIAIAINKIDIASEKQIFLQTKDWQTLLPRAEIFQISAKNGTGLDYLQAELLKHLKNPREIHIETMNDFHQAAEITREKILLHIHKELPWAAIIKTKKIIKQGRRALRIEQSIAVPQQRHRAIFIGTKGAKLKTIGSQARHDMETYFKKKVHLFIEIEVQ